MIRLAGSNKCHMKNASSPAVIKIAEHTLVDAVNLCARKNYDLAGGVLGCTSGSAPNNIHG